MYALLDSGSQANYISWKAMTKAGLRPFRKRQSYPLHVAKGQKMPGDAIIEHEVTRILHIQDNQWKMNLDVFGLAAHDIILGLPWLRERNPQIDWVNRTLSFTDQTSTIDPNPVHRQRSMTDEKMNNNSITSNPRTSQRRLNLDTKEGEYPMSKVLEKRATPAILSEY
jgi:hypothetical protein